MTAPCPDRTGELPQLPELERELSIVRETLQLLMTPEREARQRRMLDLETRQRDILGRVAVLNHARGNSSSGACGTRGIGPRGGRREIGPTGGRGQPGRVGPAVERPVVGDLAETEPFLAQSASVDEECLEAVQVRASEAGQRAVAARLLRQAERERLATARDPQGSLRHPKYSMTFPPMMNPMTPGTAVCVCWKRWSWRNPASSPRTRKRDWERRLEENVLNELNRRLTDAQQTIRLLDRYLSQPIGKFRSASASSRDTAGFRDLAAAPTPGLLRPTTR